MATILRMIRPVDIVTAILVIAWVVLKCQGINHVTDYVVIAIVGWYYGGASRREPKA